MKHADAMTIKTSCLLLLSAAIGSGAALADDQAIVAEQLSNKPADGPYISDTGVDLDFVNTSEGTTHGSGKKLYKESSRETRPQAVAFYVWGKVDSTSSFVLTFKAGGKKKLGSFGCAAPDHGDESGRTQVRCESDEGKSLSDRFDLAMGLGMHALEIGLKDAESGKVKSLRTIAFKLASAPAPDKGRTTWFVDRDHQIGEHMGMWTSSSELVLLSWVKNDKPNAWAKGESNIARCTKNGKPYVMQNVAYAGYVSSQDGKQIQTRDEKIFEWTRLTVTIGVDRDKAAGTWECKAFAGGKLWRTFKFVIGADGRIAKSAKQSKIVAPSVYLPETVMPPGADATYDKAAFKTRGFWGKPVE
jgi:hypothetical protein